jgi:pimeloyl-ACP methyl ester carboxylesterase
MSVPDTDVSHGQAAAAEHHGPEPHDVPTAGRSGYLQVDGRQVHYLEWGASAAPTVLALHGGGQTAYMFEQIGASLRDRLHVIAADLPGHGDSGSLGGRDMFTRQQLAATVPPLLDEFGIGVEFTTGPVAIIGASLGGIIALTLAAARPELVSAIVLIDVGHRLEPEGVRRIVTFMQKHESFGSLEEAAEAVSEYVPNRPKGDPQRLRRNLRQRPDGRWVWKHNLRSVNPLDLDKVDPNEMVQGLGDDLPKVTCPVLVLRGSASDVLSADGANEIVEKLPDSRIETVHNAGHLAAGDNSASTVSLIGAFFDEVLPTGN